MEWKIGEIFKCNGEWYQCVESKQDACTDCAFNPINGIGYNCSGSCTYKQVIFKKLEKVGKPYTLEDKRFQKYKIFHTPYIYNKIDCSWQSFADPYFIGLEIKQNKKEVMCIYKVAMNTDDRDYLLDKLESILHDTHCQQYKDEICEAFSKYIATESVSDLKPFDLDAAKAGNPVCTRDGRKTRIVCFDAKYDLPIVALVTEDGGKENLIRYNSNGRYTNLNKTDCDLMMLPEKKRKEDGWVNVYDDTPIYDTKEEALNRRSEIRGYIDTIKISLEE